MDLFRIFNKKQKSGDLAKSRLQFVLRQDRLNISSSVLEKMKTDILKVISTYIEIDDSELDIQVSQDGQGGAPIIIANIPVKEIKKTK